MEIKLNLKNRSASTLDNEEWAWISKQIYSGVTSYQRALPISDKSYVTPEYPTVEFTLEVV